jgi:hypothetical protein
MMFEHVTFIVNFLYCRSIGKFVDGKNIFGGGSLFKGHFQFLPNQ